MLLLDPAYPPLWRSPDCLQFGVESRAVLHDPQPWQQRVLHELARGLPESALVPVALAFGGTASDAARMLETLRPVLTAAAPRRTRVVVRRTPRCPEPLARAVLQALRSAAVPVVDESDARHADVVVLVATHVVAPVDVAMLMSEDRAHLPVVFTGTTATVGPLVHPGVTACLMCVHAAHADADPSWPALASQLVDCPPPTVAEGLEVEAGIAAARLLAADDPHAPCRSVSLRPDRATRIWHRHVPHPVCGCRDPAGTATGRATTTATAPAARG